MVKFYLYSVLSCKNYRRFKVGILQHHGVYLRTNKPVKGTLSNSDRDQMGFFDHKHEDFKSLDNDSNSYLL